MANVQLVEVVGATHAATLIEIGVLTTDQLLDTGATPGGRMKIADTTQIDIDTVNSYVHLADLLRVPGVSIGLARILCEAGMVTVPKLAYRDPDSVANVLSGHGDAKKIPDLKEIEQIIANAKTLPKVVQH